MKREEFLKVALGATGLTLMGVSSIASIRYKKYPVLVGAHVWVYAKNQPSRDVSPILPQIFSDLKYAGFDGVETMEHPLRNSSTTKVMEELTHQYQLPVMGTSYGAEMWDRTKHNEILEDVENIMGNMEKLKAHTFGTSVGHPKGRLKTEEEFDAQAELLIKLIAIGKRKGVVINLHNHTYEVENNLFDLRGTLKRIPDVKLGPDLNWLLRAKVDPVKFLTEFKNNIVFLHLRDQLQNGKWPESIGEGDVDFKEIGFTLNTINFNGNISIELAHENDFKLTRPIRESFKMSREYIRNTMGY